MSDNFYGNVQSTLVDGQALVAGGNAVDVFSLSGIAQPSHPSVAQGGGVPGTPGPLSWRYSRGATSYDVYIDESLAGRVTTSHITPSSVLTAGLHSWQVVARNGDLLTAGPRWTFAIGPPAPPIDPSLATGTDLATPPATLSWAPSFAAISYDVYLDHVLAKTVTTNQITLSPAIPGGRHVWQVLARNSYNTTAGPRWTFTTPWSRLIHGTATRPAFLQVQGVTAVTVGTKAIFVGALDASYNNPVDIYDGATHRWSTAELSEGSSGFAVTSVGNLALFAGDPVWDTTSLVDIFTFLYFRIL